MKKHFHLFTRAATGVLAAALLCACGESTPVIENAQTGGAASALSVQPSLSAASAPGTEAGGRAEETPQLSVVLSMGSMNFGNDNGFLRVEYPQNEMHSNIMFYDYQTLEQRYFCQAEGCAHNSAACGSFVDRLENVQAFFAGNELYVNYSVYGDDIGSADKETYALTRRGADGATLQTLAEGQGRLRFDNTLFCDGEAFYFTDEEGFVRLDIATGERTIFSGISITQQEYGRSTQENSDSVLVLDTVYNNQILCMRFKDNRGENGRFYSLLSDTVRELFTLDPHTGEQTILHTFAIGEMSPVTYDGSGHGYYIQPETAEAFRFDLATGEHTLVTGMLGAYNYTEERAVPFADGDEASTEIFYGASNFGVKPVGDWLILDTWILRNPQDMSSVPETKTYGYNMLTGEETEIAFGHYFNGYEHPMTIWSQTPYGLLVTEESRPITVNTTGTGGEPTSYESAYDVYALIDLDDFVHSRPNFRTIVPVEYSNPL